MNTMQFEFDAVVAHLYKQGCGSMEDGSCLYRTNDGLMCAVGCRIPDSIYHANMEYQNFVHLMYTYKGILPQEFSEYSEMFIELQRVHDDASTYSAEGFKEVLDKALPSIAADFGLTFTPPEAK